MSAILSAAPSRPAPLPSNAYDLLFTLSDTHRDWILDASRELELPAGALLVEEGQDIGHISILIEGVMRVFHPDNPRQVIASIGPGQIIGEMSFIERLPASASVKAVERCMLLTLPFGILQEKMDRDQGFRAEFNGALLNSLSGRLRSLTGKLNSLQQAGAPDPQNPAAHAPLHRALDDFKAAMFRSNELEIKRQETEFRENAAAVAEAFSTAVNAIQEHLGDDAPGTPQEKDALGYRVQQEMAPYVLMSNFLQRSYVKPRGYAGDYLTIANVYDDRAIGNGRTGELLDRLALEAPAVKAVKNRRGLLREEILRALDAAPEGEPLRVTIFACGPARELFDVYEQLEDPSRLKATLIDIDLKALAHVMDEMERFPCKLPIDLHQENLIYLALGRRQLNLPPQDLVYSIGLIDYFNDQLVVKLADYAHQILRPGGRLVLGNFHPSNPSKAFMDYVLDWRLLHRSEEDMDRLYENSRFAKPCSEIRFEAEGVNLFAMCEK